MPVIIIILLIISYCGYFAVTWNNYTSKNHKLYSKTGFCRDIKKLNMLHITGIFLLALPIAFLNKQTAIFFSGNIIISSKKLMILSGLVLLTAIIGRRSAITNTGKIPALNYLKVENQLTGYLLIRILFLFIYESFFRGVLLIVCIHYTGIEWAILINVILYTLLHAFTEIEEIAICPIFGLILCQVTIWFHSILPALLLHIALSVSYEGYILKRFSSQDINFKP